MAPSLAAAHDPPGAGVSTQPATKRSRTSATDRVATAAEQLPTTSTTSTTSRGDNSLTKLTNANVCASGLRLVSGYNVGTVCYFLAAGSRNSYIYFFNHGKSRCDSRQS